MGDANKQPLVSIYCLAYNHDKYIRNTLEGFVEQITTFPFEVYVHDDASTDDTAEIIREYAIKYPDIIKPILQDENQYSKGINIIEQYIAPKMKGKYIASCEGDDYWNDKNKLQIQVEFLEKNEEYTSCVHNTEKINFTSGKVELINNIGYDSDLTFDQVIEGGGKYFHTSSLVYRREYLVNQRPEFFYTIPNVGDYPLAIYLVIQGKMRYINRTMSVYRFLTPGSWTDRTRKKTLEDRIKLYNNKILMINQVNEYTKGRYEDVLNDTIKVIKYDIAIISSDYKTIKSDIFLKNIHAKKSKIFKLKFKLKVKFKRIYALYRFITINN